MSSIFKVQYKRTISLSDFARSVGAFVELRELADGTWTASLSKTVYTGYWLGTLGVSTGEFLYGSGYTPAFACRALVEKLSGKCFGIYRSFLPNHSINHTSVTVELTADEIRELQIVVSK